MTSSSESDSDLPEINEELLNFVKARTFSEDDKVKQIKICLQQGADINKIHLRGEQQFSLLHIAVKLRQPKVVKCLLESEANPDLKNEKNETPLDLAEQQKQKYLGKQNRVKESVSPQQRYKSRKSPEMFNKKSVYTIDKD